MNLMRGIDLKKIADKMIGASGAESKVKNKIKFWSLNYFFVVCMHRSWYVCFKRKKNTCYSRRFWDVSCQSNEERSW